MIDREKVIKILEGIGIALDMDDHHNDAQAVREAIALLKEQEVHRDGYWIEDAKTYPGAGLSNYICSNCGKTGGTWIKHIAPSRTFPWCPFCGSNMCRDGVKWDD